MFQQLLDQNKVKGSSDKVKILIILMGSLGDVLRGVSLLKPLKDSSTNFEIFWLVDSRWQSLLKGHPLIDHLLVINRPLNLANFKDLIYDLRTNHFDYVFDLQRIFKSGLLSFLANARKKICFNRRNSKELNYLFNNEEIHFYPSSFPKINHYHKFLDQIGVNSSEPYQFGLDYLRSDLPKDFCPGPKMIGLVLESSWETKDWFLESYLQLIELIISKTDNSIVLLGTKKSLLWDREILSKVDSNRVSSYVAKTNLRQLAALIGQFRLVVGPDSGPGHLASAMGVQYITIFGPTAPDRVAPYGARDLSIEANLICRPCYKKNCPYFKKACLRLITPEMVFLKIQQVLSC